MGQDLDILKTDGVTTQFTADAIRRLVRQKLTVSLEWDETNDALILTMFEARTSGGVQQPIATNFGSFVNFGITAASSTLAFYEDGTLRSSIALSAATALGSGRYRFAVTPLGGVPRVAVTIRATFNNPAVGADPAFTETQDFDFHFFGGGGMPPHEHIDAFAGDKAIGGRGML